MRYSLFTLPFFCLVIAGCKPTAEKTDIIRVEFVEACEQTRVYGSMKPKKRTSLCECVYDRTMSPLSEDEKQAARFYLLSQAGVDATSKDLATKDNVASLGKVSSAIGSAVKSCK